MSTKYDVSGEKADGDNHASIKPLSEVDLEDDAREKMLSDNDKKVSPGSNVDVGDVKFTENQNGDAKLDIGELKSAFVGMGKEELMKYANDPFWVRLRWFLFITFWLLWAAMLVGAIMIIYAAPKCDSPEEKSWWEKGPLVELDPSTTVEELKQLKSSGVEGVIVTWSGDAYAGFNDSSEFVSFLKTANASDVKVIVDLKPGSSSKWLKDSEARSADYEGYYVWAKSKGGEGTPPNNWLRTNNQSAWTFSPTRGEFYYSFDGEPQLNFRNAEVVNQFSAVLKTLISKGAKGFRLRGVPSLLVDESLANETLSTQVGVIHTDYRFYAHTKTQNLQELGPLVKTWRKVVKEGTENGPFFLDDDLTTLEPYKVNGTLAVDLPRQSSALINSVNATELVKGLNATLRLLNNTWPLWEHKTDVLPSDVLDIVTFLLPGVNLIEKNANVSQELLKLRSTSTIMYGQLQRYDVANNTLFAYTRFAPGNPGTLVVLNPTDTGVTVNLSQEIPAVSEEVTPQLFSSNYYEPDVTPKLKRSASLVPVSPKSAIVLTYVPQNKKN